MLTYLECDQQSECEEQDSPLCGGESERFGERSPAVLMLGRERVRDVLSPHLGESSALERANNIAQALALEEAQPDAVAFEMLRQLPGEDRKRLAAAVRREWLAVEFDQLRAARPAMAFAPTRRT